MSSMRTNCINCGGAIDVDEDKCPYCGTSYYDLTAIDFNSSEPVALKLKTGNVLLRMLAIPHFDSLSEETDTMDVYGGYCNSKLVTIPTSVSVKANISFSAVSKNNTLYEVQEIGLM